MILTELRRMRRNYGRKKFYNIHAQEEESFRPQEKLTKRSNKYDNQGPML